MASNFFGFLQCRLSTGSLYETLCGLLYLGDIFFLLKKKIGLQKQNVFSEKEFFL